MSKSLKNFFTVREILAKYEPQVVRFFLNFNHYRSPVDFGEEHLQEAKASYGRLKNMVIDLRARIEELEASEPNEEDEEFEKQSNILKDTFIETMDDDFNTRMAMAAMFEYTRYLNTMIANKGFICNGRQVMGKHF